MAIATEDFYLDAQIASELEYVRVAANGGAKIATKTPFQDTVESIQASVIIIKGVSTSRLG